VPHDHESDEGTPNRRRHSALHDESDAASLDAALPGHTMGGVCSRDSKAPAGPEVPAVPDQFKPEMAAQVAQYVRRSSMVEDDDGHAEMYEELLREAEKAEKAKEQTGETEVADVTKARLQGYHKTVMDTGDHTGRARSASLVIVAPSVMRRGSSAQQPSLTAMRSRAASVPGGRKPDSGNVQLITAVDVPLRRFSLTTQPVQPARMDPSTDGTGGTGDDENSFQKAVREVDGAS